MGYFNYHATAKKLIRDGKLKSFRFLAEYNGVKNVLLLIFDDDRHPVMPIRPHRQAEYFDLININPENLL